MELLCVTLRDATKEIERPSVFSFLRSCTHQTNAVEEKPPVHVLLCAVRGLKMVRVVD